MPTYSNFEIYGPDSREAQQFTPPALLNTMGGGPSVWGNNYIDLVIIGDRDLPDIYPSNGYYWSRLYFQNSDGNGFNFGCENKNYSSGDPEYLESPYTEMTLPCTNYPNDYQTGPRLPFARMGLGYDSHTGDFTSTSVGAWSTNYYSGMWNPDSSSNGAIVIVYSTEDIYINENTLLSADEFYADKDTTDGNFGFKFGVYPNLASQQHEPDESCIVPYYYTGKYVLGLDFTTAAVYDPNDGHEVRPTHAYSITPAQMIEILGSSGYEAIEQRVRFANYAVGEANYATYMVHLPGLGYTQGIRGLETNPLPQFLIENADWSMMEEARSTNVFTIAQLKAYMIEEEMDVEGLNDNAMFVSYDLKFYDENGDLAETITIDYSDLHDNGLDLEGNDGGDTEWHNTTDVNNPENQLDKIGSTPLGSPTLSGAGAFSNFWFMNKIDLAELNDILNVNRSDRWESIKELTVLMGERPFDCLLDVKMYPFDVDQLNTGKTTLSRVAIGGYLSDLQSKKLTGSPVGCKRLGGKFIKPEFNNYLDYEPYTQYLLYVPYVGFMEIDATTITNTKLTVDFLTDITTGACCVVVMADEKVVAYRQGTVGVTVPLTGTAASLSQMKDAGPVVGSANVITSALLMGSHPIAGAFLGGIGLMKDLVDQAQPTSVLMNQTSGQCSNPACNNYMPQSVYLYKIISEPALKEEDYYAYGRTNGWAVAKKAKVSDYSANSGIVKATIVDPRALTTSSYMPNCPMITEAELKEIEDILASGFYGKDTTVQQ